MRHDLIFKNKFNIRNSEVRKLVIPNNVILFDRMILNLVFGIISRIDK